MSIYTLELRPVNPLRVAKIVTNRINTGVDIETKAYCIPYTGQTEINGHKVVLTSSYYEAEKKHTFGEAKHSGQVLIDLLDNQPDTIITSGNHAYDADIFDHFLNGSKRIQLVEESEEYGVSMSILRNTRHGNTKDFSQVERNRLALSAYNAGDISAPVDLTKEPFGYNATQKIIAYNYCLLVERGIEADKVVAMGQKNSQYLAKIQDINELKSEVERLQTTVVATVVKKTTVEEGQKLVIHPLVVGLCQDFLDGKAKDFKSGLVAIESRLSELELANEDLRLELAELKQSKPSKPSKSSK
jgi:hypothetical protein